MSFSRSGSENLEYLPRCTQMKETNSSINWPQKWWSYWMWPTPRHHQRIRNAKPKSKFSTRHWKNIWHHTSTTWPWIGKPFYQHYRWALTPVTTLTSPQHHLNCYLVKRHGSPHFRMKIFRRFIMAKLPQPNTLICYKSYEKLLMHMPQIMDKKQKNNLTNMLFHIHSKTVIKCWLLKTLIQPETQNWFLTGKAQLKSLT